MLQPLLAAQRGVRGHNGWSALERGVLMTRLINTLGTVRRPCVYNYVMLTTATRPSRPDADCTDCLVVHDWPAAVMMLSWHDAVEPALVTPGNVKCLPVCCLSDNGRTLTTRKSDVPRRILDVCLRLRSKIWTYWALFVDVNTAVWALSKTLINISVQSLEYIIEKHCRQW